MTIIVDEYGAREVADAEWERICAESAAAWDAFWAALI